jgi:hypothetical protein
MKPRNIFRTTMTTLIVVLAASGSAMASTFSGAIATGYADNRFQITEGASSIVISISATGARDPAMCPACTSSYTDNYVVNFFDQAGTLLKSVNEINYLYYSMFSSSYGIGAGPVSVAVPADATSLEIVSQLYISGLLGPDGDPLSFGNLMISTNGSITAATPIPSTLPLMATGLVALVLSFWHRRRKTRTNLAAA